MAQPEAIDGRGAPTPLPAYNVERLMGPFGLFGKKIGQVSSGESLQVAAEPVWVDLRVDNRVLTIRSVAAPVEVKSEADPREFRPKVTTVLEPEKPEIHTTRPLLLIRPKDRRSPRFVIWRTNLTNAEMLAIMATDTLESVHDFYKDFDRETE